MSKNRKQAPTQTKHLTKHQLMKLWYQNMPYKNKAIENHMEEIYAGLIETIYSELLMYHQIKLPDIGVFYVSEQGGYEITRADFQNPDVEVTEYIPVKSVCRFRSSRNMKRIINHEPLPKVGKRRAGRKAVKRQSEYLDFLANNKELEDRRDEKIKEDLDAILLAKRETGSNVSSLLKENKTKYSFGNDIDWDEYEELEDEIFED